MSSYITLLLMYVAASVASQFLTSQPIELFTIAGVPIWMPLSALTLVPLVDVLRSFTQYAAEKKKMSFKQTATQMLALTMATSGMCVIFAGLPIQIFTGVLLAVTLGGAIDILVFRKMGEKFKSPVARMCFSNAAATLTGSGLVFFIAFTDLVFPASELTKPLFDVTVGWLAQSVFIWCSSIAIAFGLDKILHKK